MANSSIQPMMLTTSLHVGLAVLRIALDGASQKTLQIYRKNASFDKIIDGIHRINKAKKRFRSATPKLILQFIVMQHNEHEIAEITELARRLRMKLRLKTVNQNTNTGFLPKLEKHSRYSRSDNSTHPKALVDPPKICPFAWDYAHINWDGSVAPCCKDPNRIHTLGNVFESGSFLKIWNSTNFINFRRQYLLDRSKLDRCKSCVLPTNIL